MMLVRPSRMTDLSGIESIINENFARVSSLPRERDKLSERIDYSRRSFEQDPSLSGKEFFLFVLEDSDTGEIAGTSGINVNADPKQPFYNYRLDELIHSSPRLDVHTSVPVLYLTHELTGSTVLSSFAIKQAYKDTAYFDLLSRSRLIFISQFRDIFSEDIAVELQGVLSDNEDSSFWDSLGRHFFNMDFATADYYTGVKSRTFLAEMIPAHPVYVSMLSEEAQAVMGQADQRAEKTCQLLYREGFQDSRYIDVFDGGPTLVAKTDTVFSVQNAKQKRVLETDSNTGVHYIAANSSFEQFRCGLAQLTDGPGETLRVNKAIITQLNLVENASMSYVPL